MLFLLLYFFGLGWRSPLLPWDFTVLPKDPAVGSRQSPHMRIRVHINVAMLHPGSFSTFQYVQCNSNDFPTGGVCVSSWVWLWLGSATLRYVILLPFPSWLTSRAWCTRSPRVPTPPITRSGSRRRSTSSSVGRPVDPNPIRRCQENRTKLLPELQRYLRNTHCLYSVDMGRHLVFVFVLNY